MNRWVKVALPLLSVALFMVIAGCEGDQGPAGPAGTEGCTDACHTDNFQMETYIVAVQTEFDISEHNTGDTYVRRGSTNSPECSRCHTTEGYQYYVATGTTTALTESSRIGCFGCHAPHSTGNFGLRQQGGHDLMLGGVTFDKGNANTCGNCHQARIPSPDVDDLANDISSRYWGAHNGPQGNILVGSGLWVFTGGQPYSSAHTHNGGIDNGCVNCHMAPLPVDALAGGHSFSMEYDYRGSESINDLGCTRCHGGQDMTDRVETTVGAFEARLSDLGDDLVSLGWLDVDKAHVDPAGIEASADARGSVLNYLALFKDRSGSIHNPVYAGAVLTATEAYVGSRLP